MFPTWSHIRRVTCPRERTEFHATIDSLNGVWFRIRRVVQGLGVEPQEIVAAYVIVEPASSYYRVMTRSEQMLLLIAERI